jgi:hypothetical protein
VWTRDEVLGNFNSSIWGWLRDTHAVLTPVDLPVLAAALGVVALPTDWVATNTAVWRTAGGVRHPLGPVDRFEGDLALPTWEATGAVPIGYDEFESDTLTLQLIPRPAANGTLELVYVALTTAVNGGGATLPIPDEFATAVKYGCLGALLRKVGRLADADRAKYCEDRYNLTVELTKILLSGWA